MCVELAQATPHECGDNGGSGAFAIIRGFQDLQGELEPIPANMWVLLYILKLQLRLQVECESWLSSSVVWYLMEELEFGGSIPHCSFCN